MKNACWVVVAVVVGCSSEDPAGAGSLLTACAADGECAGGLSCVCGQCNRACSVASECADLRAGATCAPSAELGCAPAPASICAMECAGDGDCAAGETCGDGFCRPARAGDGGVDAGLDGGPPPFDGSFDAASDAEVLPDAAPGDAGTSTCPPHTWFCGPTGAETHYCNAAGDGVARTMSCRGEPCVDGYCDPEPGIDWLCGRMTNGGRGKVIGLTECPDVGLGENIGHEYSLSLRRGDRAVVRAEAISPLVGAEVRIEHPCARGSVTTCNTTELSEPGAMIEVVRIAADREAIRIRIRPLRAVGAPDDVAGARVSFEIELVPADPPPASLPMLCTAAAHECAAERSVSYCSDGTYERTAPCFDPEELDAVVCSAGNCELPNGDSCGTAVPIVRPASDVVSFEAHVRGLYDDLDPGSQCFGMGMSGADKVYRIDLDAGDRIRAEMISEDPAHLTHSLYLLSDCADPAAGCLTGSIGHRTSIGDGFTRRFRPSLSYVAPRHETVFLVVDLENRSDERDTYRQLTVRWDGTCSDGVRNGDETGIDCGGPCGPCPDAMGCVSDADCESRRCGETTRWICGRPAGCGDAVFGAGEECDDGNAIDDDWCSSGCLAARCDDGVQNGDETGVDLGGYCAMSEADVCRRAPILMLPYNFGLGTLESAWLESDFTGAADDFSPSCAPGPGVDHVYRIWFERGERIDFSVLATVGTPPLTIAIAPECGAAELACATGAGFALIDRVFEPGWYLVWVEQRGGAGPYELSIAPR